MADRPGTRRIGKPVKFGTCSSQVLSIFLDSHTSEYDLEDKKQLIWDMATAMNLELRQLAAAGAKVIQIEEPTIHFTAAFHPGGDGDARLHGRGVQPRGGRPGRRRAVDPHLLGQPDDAEGLHAASRTRTRSRSTSKRLKGDVWTVETTENDFAEIDLFKPYANSLAKKVAVGVVNHRQLQADLPSVVAGRVRRAMEVIPAEKLVLSSDCGFGRQGCNRIVAFYKAAAIAQGRNIVLKELGIEERYVRAPTRRSRPTCCPDREPLTHLPSPWT